MVRSQHLKKGNVRLNGIKHTITAPIMAAGATGGISPSVMLVTGATLPSTRCFTGLGHAVRTGLVDWHWESAGGSSSAVSSTHFD